MKFLIDPAIQIEGNLQVPYLFGKAILPDLELLTDNSNVVHNCTIPKSIRDNACTVQHETIIRPTPYINQLTTQRREMRHLYLAKPAGGMIPRDAANILYWMLFAQIDGHTFDQNEIEITANCYTLYNMYRKHTPDNESASVLIKALNLAATYLLFNPRTPISHITKIRLLLPHTDQIITVENILETVHKFNDAAAQLQKNEVEARILEGQLNTQAEIEMELQKLSKSARNEIRRRVASISAAKQRRDELKTELVKAEQKRVAKSLARKKEAFEMTADFSSLFDSLGK